MTEEEIQIAFEKAGIFMNMSDVNQDETRIQIPQVSTYKHEMTTFERIKDIVSSAALISGIAYAIYMFYKVRNLVEILKNV